MPNISGIVQKEGYVLYITRRAGDVGITEAQVTTWLGQRNVTAAKVETNIRDYILARAADLEVQVKVRTLSPFRAQVLLGDIGSAVEISWWDR